MEYLDARDRNSKKTVLKGVASISCLNQEVKMCSKTVLRSLLSSLLLLSQAPPGGEKRPASWSDALASTHPKGNPVHFPQLSSKSQGSFKWRDHYQLLGVHPPPASPEQNECISSTAYTCSRGQCDYTVSANSRTN